jgi:hypothetical protein
MTRPALRTENARQFAVDIREKRSNVNRENESPFREESGLMQE